MVSLVRGEGILCENGPWGPLGDTHRGTPCEGALDILAVIFGANGLGATGKLTYKFNTYRGG